MRLRLYLTEQAASRVLIPPSVLLLTKELHEDNAEDRRQALNTMLRQISFHVSSVHREPWR